MDKFFSFLFLFLCYHHYHHHRGSYIYMCVKLDQHQCTFALAMAIEWGCKSVRFQSITTTFSIAVRMSSKKLMKTKNTSFLNWTNRACCLMNSPLRRKVRITETLCWFSLFLWGGMREVHYVFQWRKPILKLLHVSKGGSRKLVRYCGKELTGKTSSDEVCFRCSMNYYIFLTQLDKPYSYLLFFLGLESKNKQNTDNIKALQVSELKKCTIHNFRDLP